MGPFLEKIIAFAQQVWIKRGTCWIIKNEKKKRKKEEKSRGGKKKNHVNPPIFFFSSWQHFAQQPSPFLGFCFSYIPCFFFLFFLLISSFFFQLLAVSDFFSQLHLLFFDCFFSVCELARPMSEHWKFKSKTLFLTKSWAPCGYLYEL